jgi:FkbM family methyltransferase
MSIVRRAVHAWRRARLARLGATPSWRAVGHHLEMWIDPADSMDREFYLGTYDPWLLHVVRCIVRAGDTCLDIGAHKGYVTLRLATLVGSGGRVYAFEPDPRARERLEEHGRRNWLPQVSVLPYAVGREAGDASFSLSTQLGWSSLFPNALARPTVTSTVEVAVRGLDELARTGELAVDVRKLSFIKIDTEGAEGLVLEGMRDILRASRPVLWIEINRDSLEVANTRTSHIESMLQELGFALFLPHRVRLLGVPRVVLEPLSRLDVEHASVFDVLACKQRPTALPIR